MSDDTEQCEEKTSAAVDDGIIEFSDPIILAGLEDLYREGDDLVLIETFAICYRYEIEVPAWARDAIGKASVAMLLTLAGIENQTKPFKEIVLPNMTELRQVDAAGRYEASVGVLLNSLGLKKSSTTAAEVARNLLRDCVLAESVALSCHFIREPRPHFEGVGEAIIKVASGWRRDGYPSGFVVDHLGEEAVSKVWKRYRRLIEDYYLTADAEETREPALRWLIDPRVKSQKSR